MIGFPIDEAVDDEDLAARVFAPLLITAATRREVEAIARRIHSVSARSQCPFVQTDAGDFPLDAEALRALCCALLDAAAGGSVLVNDVEEMPASVQQRLMALLADLALERPPSTAVRLIAGTSVALFDLVTERKFCHRLFYRLNVIHLVTSSARRSRRYNRAGGGRAHRAHLRRADARVSSGAALV